MWGAPFGDAMHDDGERLPTEPDQTVEAAQADAEYQLLISDPVYLWRAKVCAERCRSSYGGSSSRAGWSIGTRKLTQAPFMSRTSAA